MQACAKHMGGFFQFYFFCLRRLCMMEFHTRLNRGQASGYHCRKYGKYTYTQHFNEDTTNESASVACSNVRL